MICTHCKREFDQKGTIPRLLVVCGHSLCEACCYRLHNKDRVECPQCHSCTFVESITLLPRNLALISVGNGPELCSKHHKKYEAFCEKEYKLICIECILQDGHKNHEMDNVSKSFEKYSALWQKKISKLGRFQEKLTQMLSQTKKSTEEYRQSYQSLHQSIMLFFKEVKQVINREEEQVLSKLRQAYRMVSHRLEEKILSINENLSNTNSKSQELEIYNSFSEIDFLESYHEREEVYTSINQNIEDNIKLTPLNFHRKTSIQSISRQLQSFINEKRNSSTVTANNYHSVTSQNKKETTTIKAVRKMPASPQMTPPTSIASSQNRKKTSCKKEISTQNVVFSKITPSRESREVKQKENKPELDCSELAEQINTEISKVDPKQSLCHSFISNMTSFLSDRKSIYLVGGFNEEANNIIKLNLFSFNWEEVCSLPSNRSKFGCATFNKQIYLFGGKKGKQRVGDSEVFSISNQKWSRSSQISKKRSGFSVIPLGEILFFIGGNDGDNILNTVQTLNIVTGEWKKKDSLNEPRDELSVVVGKNNKIYAIGGFGGKDNQPLKSVEVFDPRTEKWKLIPSMNEPRRALAASVLADGIYAIGGFDGSMYLSTVQRYEEGDKQWTYVASMNQSRCTHSAVSIFESQQIYVFGGFDYIPLDSVERYNVISNEWEPICKMPTPRFMHSSLLIKED